MAPQPSIRRGRSEQILLDQVDCEARKTPAERDAFSLGAPFIELKADPLHQGPQGRNLKFGEIFCTTTRSLKGVGSSLPAHFDTFRRSRLANLMQAFNNAT
jgi:hypothetical protein